MMRSSFNQWLLKFLSFIFLSSTLIAQSFKQPPELIPYRKGDKWGYCDKNKKIVIECKYDAARRFVNGYAEVELYNYLYYLNTKGEIVVELPENYYINDEQSEQSELEMFIDDNFLFGFKDKSGSVVIKPEYQDAQEFSEGLAPVKKNNRWGYIDTKGNVIIPFKYDDADNFKDGLAIVGIDGNLGYIDAFGNEYWESLSCDVSNINWLKKNIRLNYLIDYYTPFTIELKNISDDIDFTWYKDDELGFDINITSNALNNAYKQFNYIYSKNDDTQLLLLNDATSVFCSRKMFDEMVNNKEVTYYPYAREKDFESEPVKIKFKEKKVVCVKYGSDYIGLECLSFESERGEQLVVLNNRQYPLIVKMSLDFRVDLKSINE